MKYYQETTVWTEPNAKNGIYYLSDDKQWMVGYIKYGTTDMVKYKNPIRIDTRGRKFTVIKDGEPDTVYFGRPAVDAPVASAIEVEGSGGKKYYITKRGSTYICTCSGFQFRHRCKHVDQLKEKV